MKIVCKACRKYLEVPEEILEGQHVLCPYCGNKFAYESSSTDGSQYVSATRKNDVARFRFGKKSLMIWCLALITFIAVIVGVLFCCSNTSCGEFELERTGVDVEKCPISEDAIDTALTSAEIGTGYFYTHGNVVVRQVVPKCGILIGIRSRQSPNALVLTKRIYIDDVELRPGLYVCVGTARYPNRDGFIKTVLVFEEADTRKAQQRLADMSRQKAEAELKRQKHAEEVRLELAKAEMTAREAAEKARLEAEKTRMESEAKLAKMKLEEEAKLSKLRREREAENEKRRVEAAKESEAVKARVAAEAAEEARKRHPIEQKIRAEYASNTLSQIKFDLKKYFVIEKALLPTLRTAAVTESAWQQMKKASNENNWLGILSVAKGEQLTDYPCIEEIDGLVQDIAERVFHAEFKFNFTWECVLKCSVFSEEYGLQNYDMMGDIIAFSIDRVRTHGRILLYDANTKISKVRDKYGDLCETYQRDVELGKIDQATADQKRQKMFEAFRKDVLSIMSRSGFKVDKNASQSDDVGDLLKDLDSTGLNRGSRMRIPAKKKREINPWLKTFR